MIFATLAASHSSKLKPKWWDLFVVLLSAIGMLGISIMHNLISSCGAYGFEVWGLWQE